MGKTGMGSDALVLGLNECAFCINQTSPNFDPEHLVHAGAAHASEVRCGAASHGLPIGRASSNEATISSPKCILITGATDLLLFLLRHDVTVVISYLIAELIIIRAGFFVVI